MLGSAWRTHLANPIERCRRSVSPKSLTKALNFSCTSSSRAGRVESLYVDTLPPNEAQKKAAEKFFANHLPIKSWTAEEWRNQPHSNPAFLVPEVAFLGRSNSGKSSLLNALLGQRGLCRVGSKPGKTKTMHAWSLGLRDPVTGGARPGFQGDLDSKLNVMDMPGYGFGSHNDWGNSIMKYLIARRQLRRAFLLVNPSHGLKTGDLHMLELLQTKGISYQIIATKCDHESVKRLPELLHKLQKDIRVALESSSSPTALAILDDILATGGLGDGKMNDRLNPTAMKGVNDVRWAVLRAAGLEDYAMMTQLEQKPKRAQSEAAVTLTRGQPLAAKSLSSTTTSTSKSKPKSKIGAQETRSTTVTTSKRKLNKDQQPINDSQFPWFQQDMSVSSRDNVGVGLDDLVSMTEARSMSRTHEDNRHSNRSFTQRKGRTRPHRSR